MITEKQKTELREKYNPEGSELRALQLKLLDMLLYFDGFCKSHGLKYWLTYGTCLGAVRHNGFIPWDDDIDVEMPQKDYERLIDIFQENDDYALQTHLNEPLYMLNFAKLRDKHSSVTEKDAGLAEYQHSGCFIDIFPMGHGNHPLFVYKILKQHCVWIVHMPKRHKLGKLGMRIYRLLKSIHFHIVERVWKGDNDGDRPMLRVSAGVYEYQHVIYCEDVDETVDLEYEGHMLPVPRGYDRYLTMEYGDYMQLPPESMRHGSHFLDWKLY